MDATGQCPDRCILNRTLALTWQWNLPIKKKGIPNVNTSLCQRGGGGRAGSDVLREKNLLGLLCNIATTFVVSLNKYCFLNSTHCNSKAKKKACSQTKMLLLVSWSSSILRGLIWETDHLVKEVRTTLFSQHWWTKLLGYIWVIQVAENSRLLISSLSAAHTSVKAYRMPGVIRTFQRLLAFSLGSSVTKHMLRFCTTLLRLIFGLKMTGEHKNNSYGQEWFISTRFLQPHRYLDSVKCMLTPLIFWIFSYCFWCSEFLINSVFSPLFRSLPVFADRHTSKTRWHRIIH